MRPIGSQRSVFSAREHSTNWSELDSFSDSSRDSFGDDASDEFEILPQEGLSRTYPLHPVLANTLRVPRCDYARTLLSVGWYEEALNLSYDANDTILSAAALVMTGNARGALQTLEAHIVTSAVVLFDMAYHSRGNISPRIGSVQKRYQSLLRNWLDCRSAGKEELSQVAVTRASERAHRVVVLWQVELLDWELWRRWYIIALLLITPAEATDLADDELDNPEQPPPIETTAYAVPCVSWFRYFFGLHQPHTAVSVSSSAANRADGTGQGDGQAVVRDNHGLGSGPSRTTEQVVTALLSQCSEEETSIITAITAMYTQRYRSAMIFASRFLEATQPGSTGAADNGDAHDDRHGAAAPFGQWGSFQPQPQPPPNSSRTRAVPYRARPEDHVFAYFIRCRCALAVGERTQAAEDMTALMRHADFTVKAVGCALALFGMPLDDAEAVVLASDLPQPIRRYLYAVAEYVHALTLLQLGQVEQGMAVAKAAYPITPSRSLADEFMLIIVRCATAMEDSTTILSLPLTAHCRTYLAIAPAFFGELQATGIRLHVHSTTYRLLYPRQIPVLASLRQMLPFHMNRATFFAGQRRYRDAWDDVCCAVAAADEIVGSAEFAFSDCFSLQVYLAACQIASRLLLDLLGEQVDVVRQCAAEPEDVVLQEEASAIMENNDRFAVQVMRLGTEWTTRARQFFPHSSLMESTHVMWATTVNEPRTLTRAALLARRFPRTILAQNTFTFALFFGHRVPEAIDAAQKNLQDFPHDADTLLVQQSLKEENTVYVFNYRSLIPLRYSPANKRRLYTKRMIVATVFLAMHVAFACLTLIVNIPQYVTLPEGTKPLALRLQLPSAVPLIFCAVFLMQALVATLTPVSLTHTLLSDLQFTNTWLTRPLFGLRGVVYANVINCIQISAVGNNFLIDLTFVTFLFYVVVALLSVPFTTRMWFLPSVDEPKVGVLSWLTLLSVDIVFAFLTFIPHVVLAVVEPLSSIAFNFFIPAKRPSGEDVSSSIRRRLLYHERYRYEMPSRYRPGSGSCFFHVRLMVGLFRETHPPLDTAMLADAQREEENYRAFPLVDPQLTDCVAGQPLCTAAELESLFGDDAAASERASTNRASGDDDADSVSVGSDLQEMISASAARATRGEESHSFVNPMVQVQRAMERDEERQKQLFRRSASFVLPKPDADGASQVGDGGDGRRQSSGRQRSRFAHASREPTVASRANALLELDNDDDVLVESSRPPIAAQFNRSHRYWEASQNRTDASGSQRHPPYNGRYPGDRRASVGENPLLPRRH